MGPVLVSWVAVNNDPYERGREGLAKSPPVLGPTLNLLFGNRSPYRGTVADVVLLHGDTDGRGRRACEETVEAIREREPRIRVHPERWDGDDPTDHRAIFGFLKLVMPRVRERFAGRELVIHISPGTPSMHTVWVLMAETGFVDPPFTVVKSYREGERRNLPSVVPVEVGIDTYYKAFKGAQPFHAASEDQGLVWDPARFRTDAMRHLFAEARRYARLKVPVMILGERGTGKTTLAGWLRANSPFRKPELDSRWPAVACGQYSPETMRAELFGYRKGAFTGAVRDTDGLLAVADGDTLFLDEIGDMTRDLQRLLIKVLEERSYLPLGSDRPKRSDFRLITATNIDGAELGRRLDPDFADRIGMVTLRIPPLREIRGEIPWLLRSAFNQAAARAEVPGEIDDEGVLRRLEGRMLAHPLPGNVRDLFKVAYRLLAATGDPDDPLKGDDAVEYAVEGLSAEASSGDALSAALARAFADKRPIDNMLDQGPVRTKDLERELKAFLGSELRRVAKSRGIPVESLCDITERTLRTWVLDRKQ